MVRYGEYSPLNPTCRTSSKLLLGIGEYDERKRLLQEKKKQECKEQVCTGRKECSQLNISENYVAPVTSKFTSNFADKSVQVECGTTNEDNKLHRKYVDQYVQVTGIPEEDISENLCKDEFGIPDKLSQNRKYVSGSHHLEVAADEKLSVNIEDNSVKNAIDFSVLSPRERRLIEFCGSGSYNPSFFEKWKSPIKTVAEKDSGTSAEHIDSHIPPEQLRKQAYQDELRKQIEEKQRLDAQQKEKERREEEIILKRVEQQQLRMKLEFEKEQAQRRNKVEKRMQQFESYKSRNEQDDCALKSSGSNSEHYTKFDSSLSKKIGKIKLLRHEATDSENFSTKSDIPFNSMVDNSNNKYLSVLEICQTQDILKNTGDGTESIDIEIPSHLKKNTEIVRRKRPVPTPRTKLFGDNVRTVTNSVSELSGEHSQHQLTAVSTKKENLNDSLPIPILEEANYCGYDTDETPGSDKVKSGALFRTEAKWKIPAVQKNIIQTADSCRDKHHGRILTQLGAFRKQLQLNQMRMEEKVKVVETQSDS